jgi:uncharacterized protein (TIGR02594 family)
MGEAIMSIVRWLTDEEWRTMPAYLRALHVAAQEHALYGDKNLEIIGANKGPQIKKYASAVGMSDGHPWCAMFIAWCLKKAGYEVSRDMTSACNILHKLGKPVPPMRGCIGGWCDAKKWQGHVFFVVKVHKKLGFTYVDTIEGNTNVEGSRDGVGIFRRTRRVTRNMRFVVL